MEKIKEILSGSYKLTFKEVCQEPAPNYCIAAHESFRLFATETDIIALTRVKTFTFRDCSFHFPYLATKRNGRPAIDSQYKVYRCTEVKPVLRYQKAYTKKSDNQLYINQAVKSKPIGTGIKLIHNQILQAQVWRNMIVDYGNRPRAQRAPQTCFWKGQDADWWGKYGKGGFNEGGWMYLLKRDGERFSYSKVVKTEDFVKILELSRALPRYKYFFDTLVELGYVE